MNSDTHHCDRVHETVDSGSAAAKSRVAASWRRSSVLHGLDPSSQRVSAAEEATSVRQRLERLGRFVDIAQPNLDRLFSLVGKSGCGVVLTDCDGVVLDHRYAPADVSSFESWGLRLGSDWSEAREGTNGIGTCLVEAAAVTIHRDEHFMAKNIAMSCIDAPIFGANGELVAALDVSSARADHTEAINDLISAMVLETARRIEVENFRAAHGGARIIFGEQHSKDAEGAVLLAVDADDIVIGATRKARKVFGLSQTGAFDPFPAADILGADGDCRGFEKAERAAVVRALTREKGNVSRAALALGISRATLYRHMRRLGLEK